MGAEAYGRPFSMAHEALKHFSDSFRAADELGVRNPSLSHFLNEPSLDFFLSDYVSKKHINK